MYIDVLIIQNGWIDTKVMYIKCIQMDRLMKNKSYLYNVQYLYISIMR